MTEQVIDYVHSSAIEQRMVPGKLYSAYRLAEDLGVSRSPVREALLRLEEAGLVRFERNRGFHIIPTRPEDVAEIFALRLALEVPAARRASHELTAPALAQLLHWEQTMQECAVAGDKNRFFEADQKLHDVILAVSKNKRARDLINRLRISTRLLGASTAGDARTLEDIVREHQPIVQAISNQDIEAAGAAMTEHLESTGLLLVDQACRREEADRDPHTIWRDYTATY